MIPIRKIIAAASWITEVMVSKSELLSLVFLYLYISIEHPVYFVNTIAHLFEAIRIRILADGGARSH